MARILRAYAKLGFEPVLLNTSFNLHEEPIVCSASDALRAFRSSTLDVLILGKLVVLRKPLFASLPQVCNTSRAKESASRTWAIR